MIEFKGVRFRYDNEGPEALQGVDLEIPDGIFLVVAGHNGSGKSTLSKHINGLLLPTEGQVLVNGLDTRDENNLLSIRQQVGMVFQNPDNQLVTTIVEEDVAFGPENLGVPSPEIRVRVDEALKKVGMTAYAESAAHRLSGGQKQRIAIAGMLAMEPKILVLDEATAMLDPKGREELLQTVYELNRKNGMTVIMITQYMEEAVMADRVVVMNGGQIVMDDVPQAIFSRGDELAPLGLDVPEIVRIREDLAEAGVSLPPHRVDRQPACGGPMPIVIDHLSHTYFDGATSNAAVKDVSLEIREGEFLAIIGHTGCGKTTLVQHLNGLLLPSSGRVLVDGLDTADKKQRPRIRALVGMVFQYPEYQLFADTVREDVGFGPKNMKLPEAEIALQVSEAMAMVGLSMDQFAEKSPFELSGGEKRRAALAGILAMRPKYLVLDEPMAGLDPQGRQNILGMLEQLRQDTGCSIIMVSHSMEDVARHADRILVMDHGEVKYLDTPKAVFSHSEELAGMGLSLPAPCRVAALLRQKGVDAPGDICTRDDLEAFLTRRLKA